MKFVHLALAAAAAFSTGTWAADAERDALATATRHTDFIKRVQERLNALGFNAGPLNGDSGGRTQAALAQFQLSRSLPAGGQLDAPTLAELEVDAPASSAPDTAKEKP